MATAAEKATGAATLAGMLVQAVDDHDGVAVSYKEGQDWREVSWDELGEKVRALAKGLIALGVEHGDRVAIFADTRPEWTYADFAAICAGGVAVPVYHTSSSEEAEHVLSDSATKVAFVENEELLEVVQEVLDELGDLEQIVLFEDSADDTLSLDELRERGEEVDDATLEERGEGVEPGDLFTIIYTSGTTGPPKGCLLTHENYRKDCELLEELMDMDEEAVVYVFLPLAHALTRITQMLAVDTGATIAYWQRDKEKLLEDLSEVRPTHFPAVPRIFEKIYTEAKGKAGSGLKGKALEKAVEIGRRYRDAERNGEDPGFPLKQEFELADKQILSKVRDIFGGRLELALTGAAPVAEEMLEFFYACGVLVLEGYGATETSAVTTVNTPEEFKFGTVGKPMPGTELEIDESKGGDEDDG